MTIHSKINDKVNYLKLSGKKHVYSKQLNTYLLDVQIEKIKRIFA